jgi:hypothetical protein
MGQTIRDGWIPRNLARKALDMMIWSSLQYPVPASNLTKRQGEQITKVFYRNILQSLGACRNYPMVFRHAPAALNGLALPHPYMEQGIAHICLVLMHSTTDTPTGLLLWASLEQAQLEVRLGTSFLSVPFVLLMNCLWSTIWSFISKNNIFLPDPDQVLPKQQCQRDEFIMEWMVQQTTLSQVELISCNRCCLTMEGVTFLEMESGYEMTTLVPTFPLPKFRWKNRQHKIQIVGGNAWYRSRQQLLNCLSLILWALGLLPHTATGNGFTSPLTAHFTATLSMLGTATFLPLNVPPGTIPSPTAT